MKSADNSSTKSAVSSGNRPFSLFSRYLVRAIFFLSCRVHRSWAIPPQQGGYILVANHVSHFDPPMIGCWFVRYVDWMAMEELYQARWSAWLMNALSAFPVKRNRNDAGSMRTALHRLKLGRVVGIFPEGGIRAGASSVLEGADMWPGFIAVSLLSKKPVVPCVVLGTDRLYHSRNWWPFRRVPVWMASAEAIWPRTDLPREEARRILAKEVSAAFLRLKQQVVERFHLKAADLPATPQYRKREDYLPALRKKKVTSEAPES
jgi:1-acyl-sn-glycerol-3-phosphate acyltransferase